MKTQHMQFQRKDRPWRALSAVALFGLMHLAYGQGEPLSELTLSPAHATVHGARPGAKGREVVPVAMAITDDGNREDRAMATTQLILAFESGRARAFGLEVLDERGRVVRRWNLSGRPGKNALAVDVSGLPEGRYVALFTEGQAGRLVRFRR